MLCRGAEVKIRVHWRISVEAPESMQESKLFARRLQELDERFVNTFISKKEWNAHPYEELYENSFFPQAACVTIAALIQYFLMAAFHWMLIEGIDLYFFVVKVYNIKTKVYMYHVISWGKFIILQHALETVIMLSDRQIWCCHAVNCFDFPPFFVGRSSSDLGGQFYLASLLEKKEGLQSYTSDK